MIIRVGCYYRTKNGETVRISTWAFEYPHTELNQAQKAETVVLGMLLVKSKNRWSYNYDRRGARVNVDGTRAEDTENDIAEEIYDYY